MSEIKMQDVVSALKEISESGPKVKYSPDHIVKVAPKKVCFTCENYLSRMFCPIKEISVMPTTPGCENYVASARFLAEAERIEYELLVRHHQRISGL